MVCRILRQTIVQRFVLPPGYTDMTSELESTTEIFMNCCTHTNPIFSRGSLSCSGSINLNKGDVWKYGEITSSDRYSDDYLKGTGAGVVSCSVMV